MPITEHQRRLRRGHVGGSDTPQILSLTPFPGSGPTAVYWEKIHDTPRAPTEAMSLGNWLENPLIEWASQRIGRKCRRNQFRVSSGADGGVMSASLDALVEGERANVQAKLVGGKFAGDWGPDGSDEIPDYVTAQVQHEMHVGELDRCYVAAAICTDWTIQRRLYVVARHQPLIDLIVTADVRFWWEHVEPKIPPTDEPPPIEVLKAMRREPESVVELGDAGAACVAEWEKAKATASAAKESENGWQREVIALLGEAEAGRLPDGQLLTYLSQTRRAYEVKESTFRVLRIKGAKP